MFKYIKGIWNLQDILLKHVFPTYSTNCSLQYGIKTSFRSIQIARYCFIFELGVEVFQITCQFDHILERKWRVAVWPWFSKPEKIKEIMRGHMHKSIISSIVMIFCFLLCRSHVCLRLNNFVDKLSKANGVVI